MAAGVSDEYGGSVFGDLFAWVDGVGAHRILVGRIGADPPLHAGTTETYPLWTSVFGDRVVWSQDYSGSYDADVWMYEISTGVGTTVASGPGGQYPGDLFCDTLVWTDDDGVDADVHIDDLSEGSSRTLTELPDYQFDPRVHGDLAVWTGRSGSSVDVFLTDLATGQHTPVVQADGVQRYPDIFGDVVVWADERDGDYDIYMYDLSTGRESPVCTAPGDQNDPRIFGDLIVWADERKGAGDEDVMMYDLSTGQETPITEAPGRQGGPDVYGHVVTWTQDSATGGDVLTARVDGPPTRFFALEGPTRYETAAAASAHAYRSKVPEDREGFRTVVLATGRNWPDALGASALAGVLDAPVLITQPDYVPQAILDEIARLDADRIVFVGGEDVVTPAVQAQLEAAGIARFERLEGPTRYETADAVAYRAAMLQGDRYDGTAFVATGLDFPDALAAAPIAGAEGWPILLAGPSGLTEASWSVMQTIGVDEVRILGGPGAVSTAVEQDLVGRLGAANVERLAGPTRYETAVEVADFGIDEVGMQWDELAIATGQDFPDALTGGALQARTHSLLLLTRGDSLPPAAAGKLREWRDFIARAQYLGGTDVVMPAVRDEVAQILH